jgi:hypothetical protein
MKTHDYLHWANAERLISWIRDPRQIFLKLREIWLAGRACPVRSDIDLSRLPEVKLRRAKTVPDLAAVIRLYQVNPSRLNIAPRNQQALDKLLARNVIFFLILDNTGNHVGNLGYQAPRRMLSYLQIDYSRRGRGYGLAAELAVEQIIATQGVRSVYAQVFRRNNRALSTFLSLGWDIDNDRSTEEYFTLKKNLHTRINDDHSEMIRTGQRSYK